MRSVCAGILFLLAFSARGKDSPLTLYRLENMPKASQAILHTPKTVPPGQTKIIFWNQGDNFAKESLRKTPVGDFTGLKLSSKKMSEFQMGVSDKLPAPTAVQTYADSIGLLLNSRDNQITHFPTLMASAIHYEFPVKNEPIFPFKKYRGLRVRLDLQVPTVQITSQAAAYIMSFLVFREPFAEDLKDKSKPKGKSIWYGASLFDSRGKGQLKERISRDDWEFGTGVPVVSGAIPLPGRFFSAVNHNVKGWEGYQTLEFEITPEDFKNGIQGIREKYDDYKNVSADPSDWIVTTYVMNPELWLGNKDAKALLGFSVHRIQVELIGDLPATLSQSNQ